MIFNQCTIIAQLFECFLIKSRNVMTCATGRLADRRGENSRKKEKDAKDAALVRQTPSISTFFTHKQVEGDGVEDGSSGASCLCVWVGVRGEFVPMITRPCPSVPLPYFPAFSCRCQSLTLPA